MKQWFKRLFCMHIYRAETFDLVQYQYGDATQHITNTCVKCGKTYSYFN